MACGVIFNVSSALHWSGDLKRDPRVNWQARRTRFVFFLFISYRSYLARFSQEPVWRNSIFFAVLSFNFLVFLLPDFCSPSSLCDLFFFCCFILFSRPLYFAPFTSAPFPQRSVTFGLTGNRLLIIMKNQRTFPEEHAFVEYHYISRGLWYFFPPSLLCSMSRWRFLWNYFSICVS